MLRQYALYRYGGELQLVRNLSKKDEESDSDYHPLLSDMVLRLTQSREAAAINHNVDDQRLLDSLERYIRESDIARVAGEKLLPHWYVKNAS
jgi:hypothetical protein